MSTQQSLFDNPNLVAAAAPVISLAIQSGGRTLGPRQKQFNQLLKKIEAAKAALIEMKDLEVSYLPERARRLRPLFAKMHALEEQMVIFLDQRLLNPKGLSKKVQEDITTIILGIAENMIGEERSTPAIEAIYERLAPDTDQADGGADDDQAIMAEMQEVLSGVFGVEFDVSDFIDTPEALLEAALGKAKAQQEAAEEARAARQAKRKKTARHQQQAQEALDADKAVREIYRKLASALHPDREPDATERERKAALMAEVNAANDRRDLLALLQLQLQIEQLNLEEVASMADEKLNRFNRVLKEQEKRLTEEKTLLEMQIRERLNLAWNTPISARGIDAALRLQTQQVQSNIAMMQRDLTLIRQDANLKRWAKQQTESMNDAYGLLDSLLR